MTDFSHLPDPLEIYQSHLDVLSNALIEGVFDAYSYRWHLPYINVNQSRTKIIETVEDIRETFEGLFRTFKAQHVTDYVRLSKEAYYVSDAEIHGTHVSHLLSNGMRVVPPYPSRVRMEFINDTWLETACASAIRLDGGFTLVPKVEANPVIPEFPSHDQRRI